MHTIIDRAHSHGVLPSLTGLRWIAAFVVFAFHIGLAGYFSSDAQPLTAPFRAGATGVSLFFILSGFVLAWSHKPAQGILSFWRHRVARVYPVHLAALGLALLLGATIVPRIATTDPAAVLANATLVSSWRSDWWQAGNPVSWSLACEAFFYLLFPIVMPLLRRLAGLALIVSTAAAITLVIVTPQLVQALAPSVSATTCPLTRLPEFLAGILVARLIRTGIWLGPPLLPAVLAAATGYAAALLWPDSPLAHSGYTVIGFCLLIAGLTRADLAGRRTGLSSRALVRLGTLSFSFYLVHLLVLQAVASAFPDSRPSLPAPQALALTGAVLVSALLLTGLLHRWVELPGRRLVLGSRPTAPIDTGPSDTLASGPEAVITTRR